MILSQFEVIDTGIGMSPDAQRRLFRPFEQEDSSTSRRFGGTGLGLNICKQIVEAMGGTIEAQSTQGVGSIFIFNISFLPGLAEKIEHRFAITPARIGDVLKGHKLNILLAEDNTTTQFLVYEVMKMWGHAVTVVENGKLAVEKVESEKFDIILMDMQMPVMDGTEAVRIIRRAAASIAATPIIALTADAIPENRLRYLEAGCDTVVTKPIEWSVLAHEIKTLIDHGRGTERPLASVSAEMADEKQLAVDLPLFDRQRIDGLYEGLGAELMRNLLTRCVAAMDQYLADIDRHLDAGDFAKARRAAHDLKSVCAQFGAIRAGEIARTIETEAPDLETAKTAISDLKSSVESASVDILRIQSQIGDPATRAGKTAA